MTVRPSFNEDDQSQALANLFIGARIVSFANNMEITLRSSIIMFILLQEKRPIKLLLTKSFY